MSRGSSNQVFELIFGLLELHGFHTVDAQASIIGVTPTTINNWRTGKVKALNRGKLDEVIQRVHFLSKRRGVDLVGEPSLCPIVIEEGAGPADLERQLREKWDSVYLGHKFLYYHPAGAMAWKQLLDTGYGSDLLAKGFAAAFDAALDPRVAGERSSLAGLLRWSEGKSCGIDLIGLGPGDGAKEALAIQLLIARAGPKHRLIDWLTYTPVDVSIPLLRMASEQARNLIRDRLPKESWPHFLVRPSCSDFEDGNMGFCGHLSDNPGDRRLALFLGGTFGNLKSEARFVERALGRLLRRGDMLWLEVGVRQARIEDDGLFALSKGQLRDTQETVRRSLVEGPHRRFRASVGAPLDTRMRIIPREGGATCEVPGSYNFVHDVDINPSGQRCSVMYSRRYEIDALRGWLADHGYETRFEQRSKDARGRDRTAHLLLFRARD
ncbi:MAG: L-histidine N(alpha)-methyltransferase [Myxococcales bacterium]|nr:L-histidine N(alpha)-methyltransferase [Myxococcales bacterium]MCB9756250.1 L-histidine N(alpha)-methyltransferase [Myxococcales bacterium]